MLFQLGLEGVDVVLGCGDAVDSRFRAGEVVPGIAEGACSCGTDEAADDGVTERV